MTLDALTDEVLARCDLLAGLSEESGRITRTFLCPQFREVHDHLAAWMDEAGLTVRLDAATFKGAIDDIARYALGVDADFEKLLPKA